MFNDYQMTVPWKSVKFYGAALFSRFSRPFRKRPDLTTIFLDENHLEET